jgi:hypothetical protein
MAQGAQPKAAPEEEGTLDEDLAAQVEAELAELPDEAYIRTRATGDSDGSSDDEENISDADDADISDDDGADSAHGEPSVIADTQADEPMTQARFVDHLLFSMPVKLQQAAEETCTAFCSGRQGFICFENLSRGAGRTPCMLLSVRDNGQR